MSNYQILVLMKVRLTTGKLCVNFTIDTTENNFYFFDFKKSCVLENMLQIPAIRRMQFLL